MDETKPRSSDTFCPITEGSQCVGPPQTDLHLLEHTSELVGQLLLGVAGDMQEG